MFYFDSTLNFGIPTVLIFQLEVYFKVDRLLTGLTAQQKEQLLASIQIKHLELVCCLGKGSKKKVIFITLGSDPPPLKSDNHFFGN